MNLQKFRNYIPKMLPGLVIVAICILFWRWFEFKSYRSAALAEPVLMGVIAGVVTSFLLLVFSVIWKANITPWIENLLFKDTKIEGVWNGILVPFIGIDEIDKRRVKIAFGIAERRLKRKSKRKESSNTGAETEKNVSVAASSVDSDKDIEAELIIKSRATPDRDADEKGELIDRRLFVKLTSETWPIKVRVEINRTGHDVSGHIVEIGGASDIHTYRLKGAFKNLILTGEYENTDASSIDRGGLSLMLRGNGNVLEGFFSSYADEEHRMAPFKCVLEKQEKSASEADVKEA